MARIAFPKAEIGSSSADFAWAKCEQGAQFWPLAIPLNTFDVDGGAKAFATAPMAAQTARKGNLRSPLVFDTNDELWVVSTSFWPFRRHKNPYESCPSIECNRRGSPAPSVFKVEKSQRDRGLVVVTYVGTFGVRRGEFRRPE